MGMSLDIFSLKLMNAAVVVIFFALFIWLLRFLFGPGGKFRDPQWDRWNDEARRNLERDLDQKADAPHVKRFEAYARSYFSGDQSDDRHLRLKMDHTAEVLAYAREIAAREKDFSTVGFGFEARRALALAALFHDIGRFEQFRRHRTFSDSLSFNHGRFGASILRREAFLESESPEIRRLVIMAVALHNRRTVPGGLSGKSRAVLEALRDADKLDIFRVMAGHLESPSQDDGVVLLHLADEPGSFSPEVLKALKEGRTANYEDMRFYNDFRILLCTWPGELRYAVSREIAGRQGYLDRIIAGLYNVPEAQRACRERVDAVMRGIAQTGSMPENPAFPGAA